MSILSIKLSLFMYQKFAQDAAHGFGSIADWIQREQRRNRFH